MMCKTCGHVDLDQHDTVDRMKRIEPTGLAAEVVSHLFIKLNAANAIIEKTAAERDKAILDLASLQQVVLNRRMDE